MVQGSGDVGIELVVYVREIGIGTVSAKLDALTMKELVVVGGCLSGSQTGHHSCFDQEREGMRVVVPLNRHVCLFIFA